MSNSKKIAAVIGYLTIVLNLLYNLLFTPFVLRALGQSEYGVYTLCTSVISNLSLLQFGFGTTFIRYYIRYNTMRKQRKAEELNGMFAEIFGIIGAVTAIIGVLLITNVHTVLGSKITPDEYAITETLLKILVFSTVISIAGVPFQALVTAHEKFVFQKLLQFLETFLKVAVLPPLLLLGYKSVAIVTVSAALSVITLVSNTVFVFKKLNVRFRFSNFDFRLFREMGVFSFFIFLQSIMDIFNWQIDRFLLARFWGSGEVAVYSVGAQVNSVFISLAGALTVLFVPWANQLVAEGRGDGALSALLIKLGRLQFLICTFLLSAFIFFGRPFVGFFAGAGYEKAYPVAVLLIAPLLLPLSMDLWYHIARAKSLHKTSTTIFTLVAFLNLLISIPLCKRYGETGAAAGTCIGMFLANNIFQIWYAQRVVGLDMKLWAKNLASMAPGLLLPMITGLAIMLFADMETILSFIIFACLYTVACGTSFWLFSLNQEEKGMFARPALRLCQKIFRLGGGKP